MANYNWPTELVEAASQAAEDERIHARLCQALVDALDPTIVSHLAPNEQAIELASERSLLYTAVSVSCITESMSCALLLEMKGRTTHSDCKRVVTHVLRDEITHSRIGWESLRFVAAREDVSWLEKYVNKMCAAARLNEVQDVEETDLSVFGILAPDIARRTLCDTEAQVIYPGLATFGVHPTPCS